MNFVSIPFFVLFLTMLGLCMALDNSRIASRRRLRHILLLAASYLFYGWWDWRFCLLMGALTAIAYIAAKLLDGRYRKAAITVGVVVPLVVLGIFKYLNFFVDSFCSAFGISQVSALAIILPVGISFYTFQSMSYTIDVYRGNIRAEDFLNVALYVSFFPQLVAGPIVKAQDFIPQLSQERAVTLKNLEAGLQIFVMGMFKKIVLADHLSVFVDDVFATPLAFSSFTVILAVAAYSLQIYFDFSGYSDMAIGCAKCFGYDLNANFDLPYLSKNPSEFWKRWHISLSTWLQEYLYIPLGGNRRGPVRTYINLMLTMLLGGLWHGASWTFVAWGALHGIALCVHKALRKITGGKKLFADAAAVVMNTVFVSLCWVFFRAESFTLAINVFRKIFFWSSGVQQIYTWFLFAAAVEAVYILWCFRCSKRSGGKTVVSDVHAVYFHHDLNTVKGLFLFFLEIMVTIGLAYTGGSPFIYFQF